MINELYHHGIRGQKWGVRQFQNYDGTLTAKGKLHTAGQYKSALNKIDKSLAKERRAYSDEKRSASKFKNKSDKLVEKSKTSDDEMLTIKLKKQVDKYDAKAADHDAKAEAHANNIAKGQQITKNIISNAQKEGYTVSSKLTRRNVTKGSEWVMNAIGYVGAGLIGSPVAVVSTKSMVGTKYNVKKPKDDSK